MPVKQRHAKARPHKITAEAVAAFREAMQTREVYYRCIRGEGCQSEDLDRQCPTCRAHVEASSTLNRALGLRPWQPSPLDADDDAPPPARGSLDLYTAFWPVARRLRLELEAAQEQEG